MFISVRDIDRPQQPWNGELAHQLGRNRSVLFHDLGLLPIDLALTIPGSTSSEGEQ